MFDAVQSGVPMVSTSYVASTSPNLLATQLVVIEDVPQRFADNVIELYNNKDRRIKMHLNYKRYAEGLPTWERIGETFESALIELVKNRYSLKIV